MKCEKMKCMMVEHWQSCEAPSGTYSLDGFILVYGREFTETSGTTQIVIIRQSDGFSFFSFGVIVQ